MARKQPKADYYVIIERDEDGTFVAEVPQLEGCYTQARTLDELMRRVREAIELCLEDTPRVHRVRREVLGVQRISL